MLVSTGGNDRLNKGVAALGPRAAALSGFRLVAFHIERRGGCGCMLTGSSRNRINAVYISHTL